MRKYKKCGLIILGIVSVILIISRMGYISHEKLYPITLETIETDPQLIARAVFEKELNKLASLKMKYSYRVSKYRIEEVMAKRNRNQTISFTIKYSVKPGLGAYIYWSAGDGEEKGLWVNNKVYTGEIEYKDGIYILRGHNTEKVEEE